MQKIKVNIDIEFCLMDESRLVKYLTDVLPASFNVPLVLSMEEIEKSEFRALDSFYIALKKAIKYLELKHNARYYKSPHREPSSS